MKKIRDGYEVHVNEKGYIDRAIIESISNGRTAGYVYRKWKTNEWVRDDECTPNAFRAGVNRGTIKLA